jgi:hypothetical protein
MYSWAWMTIPAEAGNPWVLVRRNDSTDELAYYLTHSPHPVPLRTLVRVAGQRWRVEESFQTGRGLTGLDEPQVRRWTSWYRWATLAMLAPDFLTVITAAEGATFPTPEGMIPLTVNEQRRLIDLPDPATPPQPRPAPALVHLATPTPSPSPPLPLPTPGRVTLITNYDCRISPGAARRQRSRRGRRTCAAS